MSLGTLIFACLGNDRLTMQKGDWVESKQIFGHLIQQNSL